MNAENVKDPLLYHKRGRSFFVIFAYIFTVRLILFRILL